jgi:SAM-dependent methyltransferase
MELWFRRYQNEFLALKGADVRGTVIELGGELQYDHARYFPLADRFVVTNIARDCEQYVDLTRMPFQDGECDAFVLVSVLEHVVESERAVSEIARALKPNGKLFATVPFGYPVHDVVDYWRFTAQGIQARLQPLEPLELVNLGGSIATCIDALRRPRGRWLGGRTMIRKAFAIALAMFGRLDRPDGFPLGYGLVARKLP